MNPNEIHAFSFDTNPNVSDQISTVARLAESLSEGDVVETPEETIGVVVAKLTSAFEWPEADGEVDASSDDPVYVVALATGGSKPYEADQLTSISQDDAFGDVEAEPSEVDDAEMASGYDGEHDVEELVNIPGVKDPHIGFDSWPPSWKKSKQPARLIALHAWVKMGATFRGCYREIKKKRLCAAFKDEILQTTAWRGWD